MDSKWYYPDHGVWRGPVLQTELVVLVRKGLLRADATIVDQLGNNCSVNSLTMGTPPSPWETNPSIPTTKDQPPVVDRTPAKPAATLPKPGPEMSVGNLIYAFIFVIVGSFWVVSCWQSHNDPTNLDKKKSEKEWRTVFHGITRLHD